MILAITLMAMALFAGPVGQQAEKAVMAPATGEYVLTSWYNEPGSPMAHHGRDGKYIFNSEDITIAASLEYPFHTILRVYNPVNGRYLDVEVVDRGPYVKPRKLDLNEIAAAYLGFRGEGVAVMFVQVVRLGEK